MSVYANGQHTEDMLDHFINGMFSPDPTDAHRFVNGKQTDTPELRLWRAVLEQAINDITRPIGKPNQLRAIRNAAIAWIEDNREREGGFVFVCHILGLDVSYARKKILAGNIRTPYSRAQIRAGYHRQRINGDQP